MYRNESRDDYWSPVGQFIASAHFPNCIRLALTELTDAVALAVGKSMAEYSAARPSEAPMGEAQSSPVGVGSVGGLIGQQVGINSQVAQRRLDRLFL
jgi:hypothetical protein